MEYFKIYLTIQCSGNHFRSIPLPLGPNTPPSFYHYPLSYSPLDIYQGNQKPPKKALKCEVHPYPFSEICSTGYNSSFRFQCGEISICCVTSWCGIVCCHGSKWLSACHNYWFSWREDILSKVTSYVTTGRIFYNHDRFAITSSFVESANVLCIFPNNLRKRRKTILYYFQPWDMYRRATIEGKPLKNSCTNGLFYLSEVSSALRLLRFPVIVQFLLSVKCFHRSGTGLGRFSWRQVKISWILFFVNE